jgi:hypothetical protein
MYLSPVAQRVGLKTFVYSHGSQCNPRWSSIQAYEMGMGATAMSCDGGLAGGDTSATSSTAGGGC